jgi:hypothetical protein
MTNQLNDILIRELEGVKSWEEIKIRLEKYNTTQTETTTKKTQAGKKVKVLNVHSARSVSAGLVSAAFADW